MRLKPKKRLGQNFLLDKNIQNKIIAACGFKPGDTVVEIGSGSGELTRLIAERVKKIYAIEIDPELCLAAAENLAEFSNVEIINADILKVSLKKILPRTKIKLVGNIPYYISSPIIEHLLSFRNNISQIFITVQKEFARRIAAGCGSKEYGSFSCFVQYYAQARIIFDIKKNSFFPAPKVDSSLVALAIRQENPFRVKDERLLFRIIRSAFNKRRKTLKNSLEGVVSKDKLEKFFAQYSICPGTRPERLSLLDFTNLSAG